MTDGLGETKWPRYATEDDLARLASPELLARVVGPVFAEVARLYGGLPSIPTLAAIIAEAIARSPLLQELDLADLDPEDALEIAEMVRLTVNEQVERFGS